MVATKLMTSEEFAQLENEDARELIDGEVEEMSPASKVHMLVVSRLNRALNAYLINVQGLLVMTGEGGFELRRNPDSVLVPDLSIMTDEQIEKMMAGAGTFSYQAPLIAIEVKSPSDREARIARKLSIYLEAGIQEVWWVRPERKEVTINRPESAPELYDGGDSLSTPLLPGFVLLVNELFEGMI